MTNQDFDNVEFVFYDENNNRILVTRYDKLVKMYEVHICGANDTKLRALMGLERLMSLLNPSTWTQVGIL